MTRRNRRRRKKIKWQKNMGSIRKCTTTEEADRFREPTGQEGEAEEETMPETYKLGKGERPKWKRDNPQVYWDLIAFNVHRLRLEKGLTAIDVDKKMGLRWFTSQVEWGNSTAFHRLQGLAETLGVGIPDLLRPITEEEMPLLKAIRWDLQERKRYKTPTTPLPALPGELPDAETPDKLKTKVPPNLWENAVPEGRWGGRSFTLQQVADDLKVSTTSLMRQVKLGAFPSPKKIGNRFRFLEKDLVAWAEKSDGIQKVNTTGGS